mgnify:CR=1 FL=1
MKSPDIIFVIIGYYSNKRVLSSLLTSISPYSVIVVNNGKVGELKGQNIKVIGGGKNLGYAGGANLGMKSAFANGAEWVVLCNQDLVATKAGVEAFVATLKTSPAGIAGPFAGGLDPNRMTTIIPSDRADYITGSCIAIHKDVYQSLGNFYEPYFLYYEEVDYCVRAKRAGFPITHLSVDGIRHEESVTLGNDSLAHQYYLSRNHLLFVERLALRQAQCYEFIRMPFTIFEHIGRKQWGALLGIRDYFLHIFGQKEHI